MARTVLRVLSYPKWYTPATVVLLLLALAAGFLGYQSTAGVTVPRELGTPSWIVLALALLALIGARAMTRRELTIDADGIEVKAAGKSTRIAWEEPHQFQYRSVTDAGTPEAVTARIVAPDGRTIDVDDTADPENERVRAPKLADQYSTTANWPKIRARVQEGEDVAFGPVRLNKERLQIGEHSFATSNGISLQVEKRLIRVGAEGKWIDSGVSVLDVMDYPCLLRAIGQVTSARPPG